MAGIIVAERATPRRPSGLQWGRPGRQLTSVKTAAIDGAVDVSQVVAAIDWVVQHRNDDRRTIRVLNLSYGTDGMQDYRVDPLTYAVENAWRAGIVVVVAGGNDGIDRLSSNNPAYDPFVIAVGAADNRHTRSATTSCPTSPAVAPAAGPTRRPRPLDRSCATPAPTRLGLPAARVGDRSSRAAERRKRPPWSRARSPCSSTAAEPDP